METGGRTASTVLEVLGNIDAMQLAIEDAAIPDRICLEHLSDIHGRLMAKAPNSHLAGLLSDLCASSMDDSLSPLVQAAVIHAQFETIHPFDDGNGRTGRALIHVVLRRRGIATSYVPPISVVLANDRDRYIRGLSQFREGAIGAWIEQFAAAAAKASELAVAAAATGRAKAAIHQAIKQLSECGVLEPISESKRNRSWEAAGLLELLEELEAGKPVPHQE